MGFGLGLMQGLQNTVAKKIEAENRIRMEATAERRYQDRMSLQRDMFKHTKERAAVQDEQWEQGHAFRKQSHADLIREQGLNRALQIGLTDRRHGYAKELGDIEYKRAKELGDIRYKRQKELEQIADDNAWARERDRQVRTDARDARLRDEAKQNQLDMMRFQAQLAAAQARDRKTMTPEQRKIHDLEVRQLEAEIKRTQAMTNRYNRMNTGTTSGASGGGSWKQWQFEDLTDLGKHVGKIAWGSGPNRGKWGDHSLNPNDPKSLDRYHSMVDAGADASVDRLFEITGGDWSMAEQALPRIWNDLWLDPDGNLRKQFTDSKNQKAIGRLRDRFMSKIEEAYKRKRFAGEFGQNIKKTGEEEVIMGMIDSELGGDASVTRPDASYFMTEVAPALDKAMADSGSFIHGTGIPQHRKYDPLSKLRRRVDAVTLHPRD